VACGAVRLVTPADTQYVGCTAPCEMSGLRAGLAGTLFRVGVCRFELCLLTQFSYRAHFALIARPLP
jgi:hypothetical protein